MATDPRSPNGNVVRRFFNSPPLPWRFFVVLFLIYGLSALVAFGAQWLGWID